MKTRNLLLTIFSIFSLASCSQDRNIASKISMSSNSNDTYVQQQVTISFNVNGGEAIKDLLYVVGDNIDLPVAKKTGYIFAGWYFDNDIFLNQCSSIKQITSSVTLFAKWVTKPVKIYFDTFYENEFQPIIMECGEEFDFDKHAPKIVRRKKLGRLEYPFTVWKDTDENTLNDNFIIQDRYYAFHANYGAPSMSDEYEIYKNNFSTDCGYLDQQYSFKKITDWTTYDFNEIPHPILDANIGMNRDIYIDSNELVMEQTQYGYHFANNGLYLPECSYNNQNEYTVEVLVKITSSISKQGNNNATFDTGFGIAMRINDENKAFVATMYDPISKMLRVGAYDKNNNYSDNSINSLCKYDLSSNDFASFHKIKVSLSGKGSSTKMDVYFDENFAFTYSDSLCSKTWFRDSAIGSKIAIFVNSCNVRIASLKVVSNDGTSTYYESHFPLNSLNFADGWKQEVGITGSNQGYYNISNGQLNIYDAYKTTHYRHQILFAPEATRLDDGIISFDLTFNKLSGEEYIDESNPNTTKYLDICFRCNDSSLNDYGCVTFRQNGNIVSYHHTGPGFSTWNSPLATFRAKAQENEMKIGVKYSISIILDNDDVSVYINDVLIKTINHAGKNLSTSNDGRIAFLASSIDLSIDNLRVTTLAEEN